MDRLAQENLHAAAAKAREAMVALGAAHIAAGRAVANNGPDFRERIFSLEQSVEALASDINNVAGPLEPHEGIRKVVNHPAHCNDATCIVCMTRKDTGAEETVRANKPLHGRAGYGG